MPQEKNVTIHNFVDYSNLSKPFLKGVRGLCIY